MRQKSELCSTLDELFCQDQKKRINAIKQIKQIGAAIGPQRVRNQLVPFLNQFIDDEPAIMIQLLEELQSFSPILGGSQHDKILLPLLINFCQLDQKQVAMKSINIIQQILQKHTDLYLETIKKLIKPDMTISKQCGVILIGSGIKKNPHAQSSFIQAYKSIVYSQNPSFRIIAAKHFKKIVQSSTNKDQICKIVQIIYNDSQDLPKLLTIDSLLLIYSTHPNVVVSKLKNLLCMGTWRINLRLCEYADHFSTVLSKIHFKALFQPSFTKMMTAQDNQVRAFSCNCLPAIAKNMSAEQNFIKLYPLIVKLSQDKVQFVRNQFAKNFVKIFTFFAPEKVKQFLIPLVVKCLKQNNLQVSTGVLCQFKQLSKHLKPDKFQQNILKPLANQISMQNWRLSIQTLDILGSIIIEQSIYTSFIAQILFRDLKNKIEAVRIKSSSILIKVIKSSPKQWCQTQILPQLLKLKEEPNYLIRQRLIAIINETMENVSAGWFEKYRKAICDMLSDKIPNIRMLALKSVNANRKLIQKNIQGLLFQLKEDTDMEIKQVAKQIKI